MNLRPRPQQKTVLNSHKMDRHLEFTFEVGEKHEVYINYYSYWGLIRPLFKDEDYDEYNKCQGGSAMVQGKFAMRIWNFCKLAGYIERQDNRNPNSVRFC